MACVRNVKKVVESARDIINPYYDLDYTNISEIYRTNSSTFSMIGEAFTFGYAQGRKATLSEIRKAAK